MTKWYSTKPVWIVSYY